MVHARLTTAAMVLVLVGGAATACGQGTTELVYGKWALDAKSAVVVTTEDLGDGRKAAHSYEFPRTLEFTNEKLIFTCGTGEDVETVSGTWKVLDEQPGKLRLEVKITDEVPDPLKLAIEFLDSDTMRPFLAEREQSMVYRRVRSKPPRSDE